MPYGAGWKENDRVQIVAKRICLIEPDEDEYTGRMVGGLYDITPPHLVDKIGTIVEVGDDRYDTDRPTGYERIHIKVLLEDGETTDWIDAEFLKRLPRRELTAEQQDRFVQAVQNADDNQITNLLRMLDNDPEAARLINRLRSFA